MTVGDKITFRRDGESHDATLLTDPDDDNDVQIHIIPDQVLTIPMEAIITGYTYPESTIGCLCGA